MKHSHQYLIYTSKWLYPCEKIKAELNSIYFQNFYYCYIDGDRGEEYAVIFTCSHELRQDLLANITKQADLLGMRHTKIVEDMPALELQVIPSAD